MAQAPGAPGQIPGARPPAEGPGAREASLRPLTDRCVKCGLCLPHCPTYELSRNEGDSPRGRISLIQGLASGALEPSARLLEHLDTCLGCRACESACPADVAFGRIMDGGRALVMSRPGSRLAAFGNSRVARVLAHPRGLGLARGLFGVARRLGLPGIGRRLPGRIGALAALLGPEARPFASAGGGTAATGADDVFLFTGCVQSVIDGATLEDARIVLEAAGYRVRVPSGQVCCGALPGHAGDPGRASELAAANRRAFGGGHEPVVSLATGCAATLLEDHRDGFSGRVRSMEALVRPRLDRLTLGPVPGRALVHEPCTQRHVTGGFADTLALLSAIPGLDVVPLPGNDRCCGAAGDHLVRHRDQAEALAAPKIEALKVEARKVESMSEAGAMFAVTSNIGCALHLGRAGGHSPPVLHPVRLLARSLRAASP